MMTGKAAGTAKGRHLSDFPGPPQSAARLMIEGHSPIGGDFVDVDGNTRGRTRGHEAS